MAKAVVLGLGVSGLAAAEFLLWKGDRVIGVEANLEVLAKNSKFEELQKKGMIAHCDSIPLDISSAALLVVSPGVPKTHPIYERAIQQGIEVIGEAELAFRHMKQRCLGITGTNGKTTVTLLIEHVLKSCGIKARALGNVGEPLTAYLMESPAEGEVVVAELSSYQLETMTSCVFDAAVLLNITPDHLDRYPSMEAYARAKCRLQKCLKEKGVFYAHCRVVEEYGHLLERRALRTLGSSSVVREESVEYLLPVEYRKKGKHEGENALAAWVLCKEFGVSKEQFCQGLMSFCKPSHRIEFVETIDGISYYDDSKGTNIDAVICAVDAMEGLVVLIVGGVDKGASYLPWLAFAKKVKYMIAIGQAADKIYEELHLSFKIERADSLEKAVVLARALAEEGECVLLSPGCSSFDMFRDYAHRGEKFKHCVHQLKEEEKKR